MLTPREKSPIPENQQRIEPASLRQAGQRAQRSTDCVIAAPDWDCPRVFNLTVHTVLLRYRPASLRVSVRLGSGKPEIKSLFPCGALSKSSHTSGLKMAQDRPQLLQLSPVFQTPHQPYRAVPSRYCSQTTEHLLQSCPIYEPLRKGIWPDHTPVARKLYGSLGDLRCTDIFIEETGVTI